MGCEEVWLWDVRCGCGEGCEEVWLWRRVYEEVWL